MSQAIAIDTFLETILSCSKFHGRPNEDVCLWIGELEEVFAILSTPSTLRVQGARLLLRDNARIWVKDYVNPTENTDAWLHFKTSLIKRFDSPAQVRLWQLKQLGSVTKYITEFEILHAKIDDINEGEAVQAFLNGLKPKLRGNFASHLIHSQNLSTIKRIAKSIDNMQYRSGNVFNMPTPFSHQQQSPVPDPMATEIDAMDIQRRPRPYRPRDLKQINLVNCACFHCHKPGHQVRQFQPRRSSLPSNTFGVSG
ncbi:hypothetical protein BGX21_010544 [Mortierella sp. AD011]|nr:hypothetical protein BGX20_006022 [Mortierella sp. AD010]KAF9393956.1 hypothetical protein BGX21_010544 [Mortierella sp. AD011]